MGPLIGLARSCNCAVVFAHHHGKPSESGGEKAYYGRGASAFGALSRTVLTLRNDETKGEGYAVLELAKSKGSQFEPTLLKLNRETRWFERCGDAPTPSREEVSVTEIAAWVTQQGGEGKTGEIVQAFKSRAGERTIKERLAEAVAMGLLLKGNRAAIRRRTLCNRATPIGIAQLHKLSKVIRRIMHYDCGSVAFRCSESRRASLG